LISIGLGAFTRKQGQDLNRAIRLKAGGNKSMKYADRYEQHWKPRQNCGNDELPTPQAEKIAAQETCSERAVRQNLLIGC
jgi:hypothetical protein